MDGAVAGPMASPGGPSHGLVVAVAVLLITEPPAVQSGIAGPYTLALREMDRCPPNEVRERGEDFIMAGKMHHSRSIKGFVFSGNATIKNNIFTQDASMVVFDCAKWDSVSGWREHFLVMPLGEFCFALEEVALDIVVLIRKYVPGFPKKCPILNGFYEAEDVPARLGQLGHFPVLPYGRFRVHVLFYKRSDMKPRGCVRTVVDVIPRLKKPS